MLTVWAREGRELLPMLLRFRNLREGLKRAGIEMVSVGLVLETDEFDTELLAE